MDWIDELNKIKGHKNWVVPRKGTKSYKLVMEMTKTNKKSNKKTNDDHKNNGIKNN